MILQHEEVCILFVIHGENSVTNPLTFNEPADTCRCICNSFPNHRNSFSRFTFQIEICFHCFLFFLFFLFFHLFKRILARRVFLHFVIVDYALFLQHVVDSVYSLGGSPPYPNESYSWCCRERLSLVLITILHPIIRLTDCSSRHCSTAEHGFSSFLDLLIRILFTLFDGFGAFVIAATLNMPGSEDGSEDHKLKRVKRVDNIGIDSGWELYFVHEERFLLIPILIFQCYLE